MLYIRTLRKLASDLNCAKTRSAEPQCTPVHEDSSTKSTKQFKAEVEFPKRSIKSFFSTYGLLLLFSTLTFANEHNSHLDLSYFLSYPSGSPTFVNNSGNSGTVDSVTVNFNSDTSCSLFSGQYIVSSGTPVQFPTTSTIGISPDSLYSAASSAGVDPNNIRSATIIMSDANGNVYLDSTGFPCVILICSGTQCTSTTVISITSYTP